MENQENKKPWWLVGITVAFLAIVVTSTLGLFPPNKAEANIPKPKLTGAAEMLRLASEQLQLGVCYKEVANGKLEIKFSETCKGSEKNISSVLPFLGKKGVFVELDKLSNSKTAVYYIYGIPEEERTMVAYK